MGADQQANQNSQLFPISIAAMERTSLWDGAGVDATSAVFAAGHIAGRFHAVAAGEFLYERGSPMRHLYVLMSGAVQVSLSERCLNGGKRERIIDLARAGALIGFADFAAGTHRADATAIGDCVVCLITPRAWDRVAAGSFDVPPLAELAASELKRALRHAMRLRLSAMSRLADFLLELGQQNGLNTQGSQSVLLPSGKNLANYLGLRPETLSRIFHKMESLDCFRRVDRRVLGAVDWSLLRKIRATTCRRHV
ncbi:Crp/Fnr family transcriptional regulator [Thiomonas sp. FB-Cd]|uniref:Crp/Fnr family transcriptional regulator n=1 Tax=Thiomonas sp. FB-Cd TaxID=1158292 RepID=UPI0004DFB8CD|nr:Crp/Fnr family transcriptional regulator [Thiomonas sp. FB-Cd]